MSCHSLVVDRSSRVDINPETSGNGVHATEISGDQPTTPADPLAGLSPEWRKFITRVSRSRCFPPIGSTLAEDDIEEHVGGMIVRAVQMSDALAELVEFEKDVNVAQCFYQLHELLVQADATMDVWSEQRRAARLSATTNNVEDSE